MQSSKVRIGPNRKLNYQEPVMNMNIGSKGLVVLVESLGRTEADKGSPCDHPTGRDALHGVRDLHQKVGRGGTRPYRCEGARLASTWWLCALCLGAGTNFIRAEEAGHHHAHSTRSTQKPAATVATTKATTSPVKFEMPPLPKGVSELKFGDFFARPVGPRGLELTEKLRQLNGQRVRILGYMVQQEEPPPGRLLLAPTPAQIHEHDNELAEDLPASMVFVSVPTMPDAAVPHAPGLLLLTGTLSVGGRPELDGRVSLVRLALDPPGSYPRSSSSRRNFSAPVGKGAERLAARTSLKDGSRP